MIRTRSARALKARFARVQILLCDVDGILTDATVSMGRSGETKRFCLPDGLGIRLMHESGLKVGWISGRPSPATQRRAKELAVDFLYESRASKVAAAEDILRQTGLGWEQVCYMGDDLIDLGLLRRAGLAVAVPHAMAEAKALAHYVTKTPGGHGAVREVIELILKAHGKWEDIIKTALLTFVLIFGLSSAQAASQAAPQATVGAKPTKGFHREDYYHGAPGQKDKLKTRFNGAEASIQFNSPLIPIKGLRLESYDPEGKTNWIVEADDCLYDREKKTAVSTNHLRVTASGGALRIEGRGFFWRQGDDSLTISNDTRATIQQKQPVTVTSRGFEFNQTERRVTFWDQVHTVDPETDMTSERLEIKLRDVNAVIEANATDSRVESIIALTNVVVLMAAQQTETRSQRAEYRLLEGRETIELTGDPSWKRAGREGKADRLWLDRKSRFVLAQGNTYAKLPGGDMMQPADLFQSLAQPTNRVAAATNDFVEIRADESRVWTNGAVFKGLVRANELAGAGEPVRLSCGLLTITNSTPSAQFDRVTMVDDVLIQQGQTNIQSSRLDYNKTTKIAKFSGKATWRLGSQSGAGDAIRLDGEHHEMAARTNAMLLMSMNAAVFPQLAPTRSTNTVNTNLPGFLKIECDEYDLVPGQAFFRGHVKATQLTGDIAKGALSCAQLIVKLSTNGNRIEHLLAEKEVQYEMGTLGSTNDPYRKLTCARMVGEAEQGVFVRLTADQNVQMQISDGVAYGDNLVYNLAEEKAELTGNPRVETPQGKLVAPVIWLDQKHDTLTVPAPWKLNFHPKPK